MWGRYPFNEVVLENGKVFGTATLVVGIYFTGKHLKEAYQED
jgi:hypothetical protein